MIVRYYKNASQSLATITDKSQVDIKITEACRLPQFVSISFPNGLLFTWTTRYGCYHTSQYNTKPQSRTLWGIFTQSVKKPTSSLNINQTNYQREKIWHGISWNKRRKSTRSILCHNLFAIQKLINCFVWYVNTIFCSRFEWNNKSFRFGS